MCITVDIQYMYIHCMDVLLCIFGESVMQVCKGPGVLLECIWFTSCHRRQVKLTND